MRNSYLSLLSFTLLLSACANTAAPVEENPPPTPDVTQEESIPTKGAVLFSGASSQFDLSQSSILFIGRSNIVDHPGGFTSFEAELSLDDSQPENLELATLSASIDMESLETDSERLTGHMLREDFFDTENFPQATFRSTNIRALGDNRYEVAGDLELKGRTERAAFTGDITDELMLLEYDLPRRTFNIGKDSYKDKLLDPLVPVEVRLVFID